MKSMKLVTCSIIFWFDAISCYPEIKDSCEYEGDSELALSDAGYSVILDGMDELEANSRTKVLYLSNKLSNISPLTILLLNMIRFCKILLGEDHTITLSTTGWS